MCLFCHTFLSYYNFVCVYLHVLLGSMIDNMELIRRVFIVYYVLFLLGLVFYKYFLTSFILSTLHFAIIFFLTYVSFLMYVFMYVYIYE